MQRDELNAEGFELCQGIYELAKTSGESVVSVDDHRIEPSLATRGEQFVQLWTSLCRAADANVGELSADVPSSPFAVFAQFAKQAGKLLYCPHIQMLEERNTRKGFFEAEMFHAVPEHLPEPLRPFIEFAYITGWRIPSEVLTLQWRQVDFDANDGVGEIRLDPETTKNRAGRAFPITDDLRVLLKSRYAEHQRLRLAGQLVPWVFFRMVAKGRGEPKEPRPIRAFNKAWAAACLAAGCPGRIPHDFRRTAVRNINRRAVSERVAMQLTGHKTRSVFDRYNIVSSGDLRTAGTLLNGLTGTKRDSRGQFRRQAKAKPPELLSKFGGAARI